MPLADGRCCQWHWQVFNGGTSGPPGYPPGAGIPSSLTFFGGQLYSSLYAEKARFGPEAADFLFKKPARPPAGDGLLINTRRAPAIPDNGPPGTGLATAISESMKGAHASCQPQCHCQPDTEWGISPFWAEIF